jgi:hypothetical protein
MLNLTAAYILLAELLTGRGRSGILWPISRKQDVRRK